MMCEFLPLEQKGAKRYENSNKEGLGTPSLQEDEPTLIERKSIRHQTVITTIIASNNVCLETDGQKQYVYVLLCLKTVVIQPGTIVDKPERSFQKQ